MGKVSLREEPFAYLILHMEHIDRYFVVSTFSIEDWSKTRKEIEMWEISKSWFSFYCVSYAVMTEVIGTVTERDPPALKMRLLENLQVDECILSGWRRGKSKNKLDFKIIKHQEC